MGSHINKEGQFQSDKHPSCPPDKVPLSVHDKKAQQHLWEYAMRHIEDFEFANDLMERLTKVGYVHKCTACRIDNEIGSEDNPHPVPARFHTCGRDPYGG